MKTLVLTLVLIAVCSLATAELGPFSSRGFGHFNGKLATWASGDTIIFVNNSNSSSDPAQTGHIIFNISTDGGANWTASEIAEVQDCLTQPTLHVSPGELLVSYSNGTFRKLAFSSNGGSQWLIYDAGRTFENSPVVEKLGLEYRSFNLDLPFPEYNQDDYTVSEDSEEFIRPQYFTQVESSMNETPVYFWGPDVVQGMVRSNSDIRIRQAGGGTNNGWPTFHGPVITSGEIISYSGATIPYDQIFLGGYLEHAPELVYEPLSLANVQGQLIGPAAYNPNTILMITVEGNSYSGMLGQISDPVREYAWVYSTYPAAELGEPLFQNQYSVADTIWTPLAPGTISGACYTPNKLWIKGNFSGHQTWASADTIMIIGDITLSGTTPGTSPDADPINNTDSVKLIAGKSVLLKYGYRDPITNTRVHPLCRADNDPIYLYASIYALGDNPNNPRRDGMFTFEYQHPHPSVPDLSIYGSFWDKIDLHRRAFPQTVTAPWPANLDYPWYNPLWPELQPYLERGTIKLWGSVYQHRRGYIHRAMYDAEHPSNGVWDIPNDFCGASSNGQYIDPSLGFTVTAMNYPGTTSGGVGYKKNYYFDNRFNLSDSPGLSQNGLWKLGMNISRLSFTAPGIQLQTLDRKDQYRKTHSKAYARTGDLALYATNDQLLKSEGDSFTDLSNLTSGDGNIQSVAIASDGSIALYQLIGFDSFYFMNYKRFSPSGELIFEGGLGAHTQLNDMVQMPDGRVIFASYRETGYLNLREMLPTGVDVEIANWPLNLAPLGDPVLNKSRLYLVPSGPDAVEVFIWLRSGDPNQSNQPGTIYHSRASFPVSNNDPAAPPVQQISFSSYPNPMHSELKLELEIPASSSHRIDIFNLKGQKITSLSDASNKTGKLIYIWNGTDASGRACAPGIYLIKLFVDDKPIRSKRVCRF